MKKEKKKLRYMKIVLLYVAAVVESAYKGCRVM